MQNEQQHPAISVSGHGPAVVLLHSSMGSKAQWCALTALLAQEFRCIAIDLCGYGGAPMPASARGAPHTLHDEVAWVAGCLDRVLSPGTAYHLVGHSFGGAVALQLARRQAARVLSMSVYEPVAFHMLERTDALRISVDELVARMRALPQQEAAAAFIDYWSGAGSFARFPAAAQEQMAAQVDKALLDFEAICADYLEWQPARSGIPCCVMSGALSPAPVRKIARLLDATVRLELEAGHMAPLTHAQLVNDVLAAFLRQQQAALADASNRPKYGADYRFGSAA